MAGERYAQQIIQSTHPGDGQTLSIWLAGEYRQFTAVWRYVDHATEPLTFRVFNSTGGLAMPNVQATADDLRQAIEADLATRGLADTYSFSVAYIEPTTPEDADGDGVVDDSSVESTGMYKGQLTITARTYDEALDFEPLVIGAYGSPGNDFNRIRELSRQATQQALTITPTVTVAACFGSATAAVALVVAGGQAPLVIRWDDGVTTLQRGNLPAGTYRVTLTDANLASMFRDVVVGQNPRLEVVVEKTDALVTLVVSGGTAPYSFLWSDGSTLASRADLTDGAFSCVITDAQGCTREVVVDFSRLGYYFSRNPIPLRLDAGDAYRADPTTLPNLTFTCQVLVEEQYLSGDFTALGTELEQPADRAGRTNFQVQELLAPYLDYHVPAPVGPVAERASSLFKRFYLRHAQVSGNPPAKGASTVAEQHYVLLGGLSFLEARARTWFDSYQPQRKPFLTWEPREKWVFADQPEFLYYQALAPTPSLKMVVDFAFNDGTDLLLLVGEVVQIQRYEVFCFGCGLQQLGPERLTAEQLARLDHWHVWVEDDDGIRISEMRKFNLDRSAQAFCRYVLYANSLGGMNTLVATGEAQQDAEVTGDQVELNLPLDYDPLRGDTAVLERELKPVLKLASGVRLGRAEHLGLQELLLSRRVLLLNAGRWLAGYVKTKTVNVVDDGKRVPTLEVDFVLPAERQFTPYLPPVATEAVGPDSGAL